MAAGDIIKTHAISIEKVDIDADEDWAIGEVINDLGSGTGFEQADEAGKGPFMVALETRVYATDTAAGKAHTAKALFSGIVEVLKVTGALTKGKFVQVSATAGSVMAWNEEITDVYAIVGIVNKDAASGDATVQLRVRC